MGSVDSAKKLTQTVQNSKYTTTDNKEINRIHVSTLCPNSSKEFDSDSYAYKLAQLSGGIAVSNYNASPEPEVQDMTAKTVNVLASNAKSSNTSVSITKNLVQILGEGNDGTYKIISSIGLDTIKLNQKLTKGSAEDYDKDGISDWDEVCVEAIEKINGDKITAGTIGSKDLPSLFQCMQYYIAHGKGYVETGFMKFVNENSGSPYSNLAYIYVLPINSDPTEPDSDGDGFYDGITGKYKPTGYYKIKDKWPLTDKPKDNLLQKDGQFYFNTLTVAETHVGGRKYTGHSGALPIDLQSLIYNICSDLNVDPNMIFAIALHESGFQSNLKNHYSTASGYMQLLDKTWGYYAYTNGEYHDRYSDIFKKYKINLTDKNDPMANIAVGACCFAQCKKEKGSNSSLQTIVGYYGEGNNAASTLEILEYHKVVTDYLNELFEIE